MRFVNGRMHVVEKALAPVLNPLRLDPSQSLESVSVADMSVSQCRTLYPMIRAINSGRPTRNFTFYTRQSLMGKENGPDSTGYYSYVRPFGKPIIREHQLQAEQGLFGPVGEADPPMGRAIYSTYVKRGATEAQTPNKPGFPGTVEGDGYLLVVAAISEEQAMNRILGGQYHTVSIGADVESVVESISGIDLAKAYRNGEELPTYERGMFYLVNGENKLSYWTMGPIRGRELSFVNSPSDEQAGVVQKDIGEYGLQLLIGQKKMGSKEFALYDAKTLDMVMESTHEGAWDTSYSFVDSMEYQPNTVLVPAGGGGFMACESLQTSISNTEPQMEQNKMDKILEGIKTEATVQANRQYLAEALNGVDTLTLDEPAQKVLESLLPAELVTELPAVANGETTLVFSNEPAMQEATDKATELVGSWTEQSAGLAMVLYLATEAHTVEFPQDETRPCTLGDVWGEKAGELKDKALGMTLGEFRALKAEDLTGSWEHSMLQNKFEDGCTEFAVATVVMGCQSEACTKAWETVADSTLINTAEDFAKLEGLAETWSYDDASLTAAKTQLESFNTLKDSVGMKLMEALNTDKLNEFDFSTLTFETKLPSPLLVTSEFFVQKYFQTESSIGVREYLAPLVGIVRKLNVDKKTLEAAGKAYGYLGSGVLRTYLAGIPESAGEPAAPTTASEKSNNPIQVIPSVAATGTDLSDTEPTSVTESQTRVSRMQAFRVERKSRSKK